MRLIIVGQLHNQVTRAIAIAKSHDAKVTHCPDIENALQLIRTGNSADLVLVDVMLEIKQFIDNLAAERITIEVAAYGIDSDSSAATSAIKAGAKEFIPFPPDEEMIAAMLESISVEQNDIIYKSATMEQLIRMAEQIAPSAANVLITGESGTGKEVIANHIHNKSNRNRNNFVSVNCAAIPENLLESELFGHEKGAFTGASHRRIGKFEESSGGTLLLDEISEMDLRLQAKLLRAIQEKEIDRVGGTQPVKVDLRVLATSNRDLQRSIKEGEFREDLYFRLNVINLNVPSLRDRKEDIKLLAEYFTKHYSEVNGIENKQISKPALEKLETYHWPGNVRELENTIHRAVLIACGNEIDDSSIILSYDSEPQNISEAADTSDIEPINLVGRTVENVEKELIINTLDHCLGNRTNAAKLLGISIRTLRNKLNQYKESA